jgi:hypothetical protein
MNRFSISVVAIATLVSAISAGAQTTNRQTRNTPSGPEQSQAATTSQQDEQPRVVQGSATTTSSTSASANAGAGSFGLSSGTVVHAELVTTLDARKCHPGQRVVAKTTSNVKQDGHVVLQKGTQLIGHVTEAQAKTKANAESSLGIAFEEAVSKTGKSIPFHAAIQALAQARSAASLDNDGLMDRADQMGSAGATGPASGRGGLLGSAGSAIGSTMSTAGGATDVVGGLGARGQLASNSSGIFGLRDLRLSSAASNATEGSVIASPHGSVHLSSGTEMLLRVTPE